METTLMPFGRLRILWTNNFATTSTASRPHESSSLSLTKESIGNRKSNRPGGAVGGSFVAKRSGADEKLVSVFANSFLAITKRTIYDLAPSSATQSVDQPTRAHSTSFRS